MAEAGLRAAIHNTKASCSLKSAAWKAEIQGKADPDEVMSTNDKPHCVTTVWYILGAFSPTRPCIVVTGHCSARLPAAKNSPRLVRVSRISHHQAGFGLRSYAVKVSFFHVKSRILLISRNLIETQGECEEKRINIFCLLVELTNAMQCNARVLLLCIIRGPSHSPVRLAHLASLCAYNF